MCKFILYKKYKTDDINLWSNWDSLFRNIQGDSKCISSSDDCRSLVFLDEFIAGISYGHNKYYVYLSSGYVKYQEKAGQGNISELVKMIENCNEKKKAWIVHTEKLISFHEEENSEIFEAEEEAFWMYIRGLVTCGYKIQ